MFGSVFGPRLVSVYSDYFDNLFNSELIVGYIVAIVGMLFASASVLTFTSSTSSLREPAEVEEVAKKANESKKDGNILTLLLVLNHFTMVVICLLYTSPSPRD